VAYTFKHGDKPLEGFTIQRGIGRGGFGEVYYAISDGGREVALKYLRENPDIELRGVTACMNLKSHHLVSIFDIKKNADGEYFIIMEHVAGPSLRDLLIAEPKGLGVEKAAFFLREIGSGLSYLHERGIVHRDMKPANIFYEDGHVKIGDYGLSKFISVSRHSAQTASIGTVHYMAPEVGSGNYTRGIDIYAMGVMLYEMLLGRVPFEGSSLGEVLMKHLTAQPEVDELPDPFGKVIRKALAKDPQDRYQTVDEMLDDVLEVGAVRDSLAGFNPATITTAPRQPMPEHMHSPVHSPNPPRPRSTPFVELQAGMRDLADAAGNALKMAAGTAPRPPARPAYALSPEAASGNIRYAGFWIRALAVFMDAMFVGMIGSLFANQQATGVLMILYQGILIGTWNGQTLGKRVCGIKIISADGRPCSVGQAFGRAFAKILSTLTLLIGYLMVPFDSQRRALHDRIAGTLAAYAIDPQPVAGTA
jgi:uncharacterized RDD family membrane protein YckC